MMEHSDRDPALDPALDTVTRRTLLIRVGAGAVAASLGGPAVGHAPTPQALENESLAHEPVRFRSGETEVEAFFCRPKTNGKRANVVVVHEIFGLNDHIRDVACRFAEQGYNALAVNYFTREGPPPAMEGGLDRLMAFASRIPDAQILADTRAAAEYLRQRGDSTGSVGLVGFCWGGYYAMLSAAEVPDLKAVVAYYGRIRLPEKTAARPAAPIDLVARMQAPLLGHFGALDRSIPPSDAEALRGALKAHGRTGEVYIYEGAGHAFNNDTRESYNPEAAKLAWQRTLGWFARYLRR